MRFAYFSIFYSHFAPVEVEFRVVRIGAVPWRVSMQQLEHDHPNPPERFVSDVSNVEIQLFPVCFVSTYQKKLTHLRTYHVFESDNIRCHPESVVSDPIGEYDVAIDQLGLYSALLANRPVIYLIDWKP